MRSIAYSDSISNKKTSRKSQRSLIRPTLKAQSLRSHLLGLGGGGWVEEVVDTFHQRNLEGNLVIATTALTLALIGHGPSIEVAWEWTHAVTLPNPDVTLGFTALVR